MAAALRPARPADAPAVLALYAPHVRDGYASFEGAPPTAAEMAGRLRHTLARLPWLVCAEGDRVLGYAYASPHRARDGYRWAAEVSVYVAPEAHRRGVGRALYTALLGLLAAQGYVNAYAGIALPNDASVALHEALGFRLVARYDAIGFKAGAWRDVGWWHRRLRPPPPAPAPPFPFPALAPAARDAALRAGEALLTPRPPRA